jgi:hypothetical protein
MTDKKPISPELQRRKAAAAAMADKYCNKDGGDPNLDQLSKLGPLQYGKVRSAVADSAGVPVKILDDALKLHRKTTKGGAFADDLPPGPDPWDSQVDGARLLTAKAIALIGKLPPTLSSRSLHIKVQRKLVSDAVTPIRADRLADLVPIHRKAARWSADNINQLRASDPEMPAELTSRSADNWRPLIAIADIAGGEWPAKVRDIAAKAAAAERDEIAAILLLRDLRVIFNRRDIAGIHSDDLIAELVDIEDRPWAEWKAGRPITKNQLARLLGSFEVAPSQIWDGSKKKNGYQLKKLEPVFERYLSGASVPQSSKTLEPLPDKGLRGKQNSKADLPLEFQKDLQPLKGNGSRGLELPQTEPARAFRCLACDDLGCPHCQPENFGLPPRGRSAP